MVLMARQRVKLYFRHKGIFIPATVGSTRSGGCEVWTGL